ncbi:flagellar basal body-associated protein FliL [Shewanella surugensis]|uniref:Flagellar protein FliL n=1 Tax=Shewanella surugensis TaxID=212020 RepID=A0ABT0L978_9GAMM|nr:flagellar basal body-associated protein FliL [Shewanella surugensis]MCL1124035.1 flagellar basal body-associated protein FliL [Shewanella surugensis]
MGKWLLLLLTFVSAFNVNGTENQVLKNYAYYGLEPDIVTNYISSSKKRSFVRVNVELMVNDPQSLIELEHHDPLLRSTILEILGAQSEEQIKSMIGKESIRRECFEAVNRLLEQEVGERLVVNLLFTQYLYN